MLEVERVDAHAAVEDVRAADELGEHDDAVLPEDALGEHVLEREEVEAVARRAVEVDVQQRQQRAAGAPKETDIRRAGGANDA